MFLVYTYYVKQELILGAEFLDLLHFAFTTQFVARETDGEKSRHNERRMLL
jgi:hypothetical protein